jgi:hypothetical protein
MLSFHRRRMGGNDGTNDRRSEAYTRHAKSALQPDNHYGDSASLANNLDKDVAEKRRLLEAPDILK